MDLGITYVEDAPGGLPNVPEVPLGEIELDAEAQKKYGIGEARPRGFNSLLTFDISEVRDEVLRRTEEMNRLGYNKFPIVQSGTYTHNKIGLLNPAERAWVEAVGPTLYEESQHIYGLQTLPEYEATYRWMEDNAAGYMKYHFSKARDGKVFADGANFIGSERYASSVPWFPALPSYNMMWPADTTAEELQYINGHYGEFDPIRATYTTVRKITREEAARVRANPRNVDGRPVEWVREGPAGKIYHVVNMAFDPEMRPHFERLADVLELNADIMVDGARLEPTFRDYTLTMAGAFRNGDFEGLLKADLAQYKGGLYLSMFPHEWYGVDGGVKNPMMMEVGVRDLDLFRRLLARAYAFDSLGERTASVAGRAGLKGYQSPHLDVGSVERLAVFYWPLKVGGFLRAYKRDAGGHNLPTREFEGIEDTRVVMLLDTLESWAPFIKGVAAEVFDPPVEVCATFNGIVAYAVGHEAMHNMQIKPLTRTTGGKALSDAFQIWRGVLIEPWADAGSILFHHKLLEDGRISEEEYKTAVYSGIVNNIVRMYPRDSALSDGTIAEGPHITGSNMLVGWLYQEGALYYKDSRFHLDEKKVIPAVEKFFDTHAKYAARGDLNGFKGFVRECVTALPPEVEQEILKKKAAFPTHTVLHRNDLEFPR